MNLGVGRHMISQNIDKIKGFFAAEEYVLDEIFKININRVFYLAIIMIVMRVLTIIVFLNKTTTGDANEILWRNGIILSHTVYLVILLVLGAIAYRVRRGVQANTLTVAAQYLMAATLLVFGTVVVSIDQLVTSSITPFLIACIAVGVIFILKPLHSSLLFLLAYIFYYFAIGFLQVETSIILSNRVNGMTSVILGLFLSLTLWRINVINIQQKECIRSQQEELEEKNKVLQHLAMYDFLTGLINRRYFEEKISLEMSRIKRYGMESCLLILDIDNFKDINDQFGHPIGDEVLVRFATLLKSQLRESDIIARVGGEEFAILLINTDKETGRTVAEKIRQSIAGEVFVFEGQEVGITVSIGITSLDSKIDSYRDAYTHADRALYSAKAKGKNRVEVHVEG